MTTVESCFCSFNRKYSANNLVFYEKNNPAYGGVKTYSNKTLESHVKNYPSRF
jgi:hypothetical protein